VTRRKDLPEERIESVLAGITDDASVAACETKAVFDNFLRDIETTRAAD
jgi:GMP synthase (glutamine-hydrolysing)